MDCAAENKPFGIIACDVLQFEVESRVERLQLKPLAVRMLEMGKHDFPDGLRKDLQGTVAELEDLGCRRLLFAYGLCSNSILGVKSRTAELVFPRAHDCITLFLGSKERYAAIQKKDPGTYWFSPGWSRGQRVPGPGHFERMEAQYREQFDEDEVEYLMEMEHDKFAHYNVAAYTDLGDGDVEASKGDAQAAAGMLGMDYREHPGDEGLLCRLLSGPWGEDEFLVVPPGQTAAYSPDERILRCEACKGPDRES